MAIQTIDVTIDELDFHILQFGGMTGIKMEKRILTLLAPVLKALDGVKGQSMMDMDMTGLASVIKDMLIELDDNTLDKLIKDMVRSTAVDYKGMNGEDGGAQPLSKDVIFNDVFAGKNMAIIKLLIEIMKANRFAFFELVDGGIAKTGMLSGLMKSVKS